MPSIKPLVFQSRCRLPAHPPIGHASPSQTRTRSDQHLERSPRSHDSHPLKKYPSIAALLVWMCSLFCLASALSAAPLRRPVSPTTPMLLIHALYPKDAQRIIDAIPADIRPYVVLNLAMRSANGDGYQVADAWLNTCAQNGIWAMVQPSSGVNNSMSDTDLTNYELLYQKYPNLIGYNFCEQSWGFDTASFTQRLGFLGQLITLADTYGGYLYVNDCFSLSNSSWNTIAKFKASQTFANLTRTHKANVIYGNKFTHSFGYYDNQSGALGAYLSGHAGTYAVRFDQYAWGWSGRGIVFGAENPTGRMDMFGVNPLLGCPEVPMGVPIIEEMLLHGASVIDGPEVPEYSNIYYNGQPTPAFTNMISDIFRKVLDGTIAPPSAAEVAARAKIAFVPLSSVNPPSDLYTGLYEMDGQRASNRTWFKKTGRYPAIPTLFTNGSNQTSLFSPANVVTSSNYTSRWPNQQAKINEFNTLFPADSTGDLFAGRHLNKWLTYNPHINTDISSNGVLSLKYNTCTSLELTYPAHTLGVVTETASNIKIYLNNYRSDKTQMWADYPAGIPTSQEAFYLLNPVVSQLRTSVIKIHGATSQPTYTLTQRGEHPPSSASTTWSGGVFTLTIQHNGPVDLNIQCAGSATRPPAPAPAVVTPPAAPPAYNVSPYVKTYAVGFSGQSGVDVERYDEIGLNVNSISNGDWIRFRDVDFGAGATGFVARAAGTASGNIELRLNGPTGTLIGTCAVTSTGSSNTWKTFSTTVNGTLASGVHDLYLRFTGGSSSSLFEFATWQFGSSSTAPFAPDDHAALLVANGQVLVSWAAIPGATSYRVKRALNSGGPYTTIATNLTGTTRTDTNVSNGVNYYYVISAVNAVGESLNSAEMSLLAKRVLSPVADTYVQDGGSAGTNFGTSTSMIVKYDANPNSGFTRESFLRFNVTGLASAGSAHLRLIPVFSDSPTPTINYEFVTNDTWSETGMVWTSRVPGSGTILATSTTCTVGEPMLFDLTSRFVTEAGGDGGLSLRLSAPAPGGPRVDFGTRENTSIGNRPVIEYLLPAPAAPTGLSATPDNTTAVLNWTASPGATSYLVKRASSLAGPYQIIASGVTTTTFTDTGLPEYQHYFYVVSALNAENQSPNSAAAASVTRAPARFAHLRFDDGFGSTATDSTGNGWAGTLVNGPAWVGGSAARINGALELTPASTQHVTLPDGIVSNLTDFTISCWVNLDTVGTWSRIFDFSTGTTQNSMYLTPRTSGNVVRFGLRVNGVAQNVEGTAALPAGVWTHVAITLSGSTATLYVDGIAVGTNTAVTHEPSGLGITTQNFIGKSASTDPFLDGTVDEFQIYDRALDAGHIADLAAPPAAPENLLATPANASVILDWDPVPGVLSYTVKRSATSGGPYTTVATVYEVTHIDTPLVNGTPYYYVITANNSAAESSNSSESYAVPGPLSTYLRFDDGDGLTATDASGNGWHGTRVGSSTWVTGTDARYRGALKLTGGHVTLPEGIVAGLDDCTISFWLKPDSLNTWARVFDFNNGTTSTSMYFVPQTAGGLVRFGLSGQILEAPANVQFTLGVWTHITITLSGNTTTMYFDGVPVATTTTMTNNPSGLGATLNNFIGKSASTADPTLRATIDDFRIYEGALSSSEITALAAPGTPTVSSLNRVNATPSNASTVNWTLIFGSATTGVTASQFSLSGTAASGASVGTPTTTNAGVSWNIPVTTGSGSGTLQLNLANATGLSQVISTSLPFSGEAYTMDKTPPTIAIGAPSASLTRSGPITYTITYSDSNFSSSTLANQNITLNSTGSASGTVNVTGSGTTRTVTISSITGNGTLGISVAAQTASDTAGNTATAAGPSTTFTVDNTAPAITSGATASGTYRAAGFSYTITASGSAVSYGVSGLPAGLGVNTASGAITGTPTQAGTFNATITATDAAGNQGSAPLTITINPATLTVTAEAKSRAFGASNPALTATITGFVNNETQAVVSGAASLSTAANAASIPGAYPITAALGTLSATNYTFTFVDGTLSVTALTYADWKTTNFDPVDQSNDAISGSNADPDGDGLKNLAEYALGTNPHSFTPQPAVSRTGNQLSITFQRPAHISDVTYFAEASDTLLTWEDLMLEVLNPGNNPETVKATKTLSEPLPARQLIRLRFVR
ncbi:MAG: LamG-like jellyroll fold domain-containing protein [Akkermansiaceae bacterium]